MDLPVMPPVAPMLAKAVAGIPPGRFYEPKWDGFRSIVFRDGDEVEIGSRNERPMTRYFPEVADAVRASVPPRCVLDGEIVVAGATGGLDFWALQQRLHPAASRVAAARRADAGALRRVRPARARRRGLHGAAVPRAARRAGAGARRARRRRSTSPRSRATRRSPRRWFERFEGAGLDGVIAKDGDDALPARQARDGEDQARPHRRLRAGRLPRAQVGPGRDRLAAARPLRRRRHAGVAVGGRVRRAAVGRRRRRVPDGAPARAVRRAAAARLRHRRPPVAAGSRARRRSRARREGSRWNPGKDLSFVPLRPERVLEVRYDHMEGARFRHPPQFVRWRPDRDAGVVRLRAARAAGPVRPRGRARGASP